MRAHALYLLTVAILATVMVGYVASLILRFAAELRHF
jgi:hypothetical protein